MVSSIGAVSVFISSPSGSISSPLKPKLNGAAIVVQFRCAADSVRNWLILESMLDSMSQSNGL